MSKLDAFSAYSSRSFLFFMLTSIKSFRRTTLIKNTAFFGGLIKYTVIFLLFAMLNSVYPNVFGATSLYIGLLYGATSPPILSLTFLLSFGIFRSYQMLLIGVFQAIILGGIFCLYRIKNLKPKIEIVFYYVIAVLPYVVWGSDLTQNIAYSAIICLFSFISIPAVSVFETIKNRAVPPIFNQIALAIVFCLLGIGGINLFGENTYKAFAVFCLLFIEKCFQKRSLGSAFGIFSLPLAVVKSDPSYFCVLFLWFAFSKIFTETKTFFSAFGLMAGEALCVFIGLYSNYSAVDALFVAVPALIFCFLPNSLFETIDNYFNLKPDELLCYGYINRTKATLSNRLYEMSGVFFQMQSSFAELKECTLSKELIVDKIAEETKRCVCSSCVFKDRCELKEFPDIETMRKFIDIGIAKNRITLIDLPRNFTDNCGYPNSIIFEVNRLIGEFCVELKTADDATSGKQIVSSQVEALGKIMKEMAFDLSKALPHDQKSEREVLDFMKKRGLPLSGALIFGEGENTEVSVFASVKVVENNRFLPTLSRALGAKLVATNITTYNDNLVAVTHKKSPTLDAVFGVRSVTKSGFSTCGDTHSLIKIDEGRFLVALSDGMGSGTTAERTSSASLSLIESFYRAGLDSDTVLKTVNNVLSLATTDNFAAVDIGIVNLYESESDFIKIGAPYGFILNEQGVRFIEGSSLPLGIIEELKPSMTTLPIGRDDVIVLLSDGVTDAFGSSCEMIEFLRSSPIKNPQALSDSIVEQAIALSHGVLRDDMTALCVRLVEKIA